jgi:hypothetical protein
MDNQTQFWQNPVNSLIFLIFILIKETWYYILSSLRYDFFIYVLFNDTHLQLFQQPWNLYNQK